MGTKIMHAPAKEVTVGKWYVLQTLSNQEAKVERYLDKFMKTENVSDYVEKVLVPIEWITEMRQGKKITKRKKLYPGYVFIFMHLYDSAGKILQEPWHFVRNIEGVIGLVGGARPTFLKEEEVERIMEQVKLSEEGASRLKLSYKVGENVKINDGPFTGLTGRVEEVDEKGGRLKVSVSIFGRFTPVEIEYWQVEKTNED